MSPNDENYILNNNLTLKLDDKIISKVQKTKYLGITINNNLDWKDHVNELIKKLEVLMVFFININSI